jgi:hypothetical protein
MDYPHPWVELKEDGSLDVSRAYATGIGEWDKAAIAYGYQEFPAAGERVGLDCILQKAQAEGLVFITDQDARLDEGAHPRAHLWDNGPNAVDELERVLRVRARALARFSERNIPAGRAYSALEEQLVLVYLFHRYQVEAAAKVLGGLDYTYALRGDGQVVTALIPAEEQARALDALLVTLQPGTLALPENVLRIIPPRAYGFDLTRELFPRKTTPTFDALAAPEVAANLTIRLLLDPARAARLIEYHARDARLPGLADVLDKLLSATWKAPPQAGYAGEIQRIVNDVVLYHLIGLAAGEKSSGQARALTYLKLDQLKQWLVRQDKKQMDDRERAQHELAIARIQRFQKDPAPPALVKPLEPPPGQPIGSAESGCGW